MVMKPKRRATLMWNSEVQDMIVFARTQGVYSFEELPNNLPLIKCR